MSTYSPVTPMTKDSEYGFSMNATIQATLKQNFKALLLTNPGERVMKPLFGVGLQRFLFEQFRPTTYSNIEDRIRSQTATYIPAIIISDIIFNSSNMDNNQIGITIKYAIRGIGATDSISL